MSGKKILAFNLPQYHAIPENDEWWGKGFTEWTNVRRARPLFKEHQQPMIPYNHYYYDLSKKEDVVRQVELAKEYGIFGFVYYHYWFSGHLLLQKPCEILLEARDVDFHYCFCWANEPWTRTWDGKPGQVLYPQNYGGQDDWENHIQYLLPFFRDSRYIKRDGKPMLFVYAAKNIAHLDDMIEYWNRRMAEEGFPGIFFVEFIDTPNPDAVSRHSQAVIEFEPMYTNRFGISPATKLKRFIVKKVKVVDYLDYDRAWKSILRKRRTYGDREIFHGAFCSWDNSPRKGTKASTIMMRATPEKFEEYLARLMRCDRENGSDLIIINAWNEWGEGAVLEPSEQNQFRYLEAVRHVAGKFGDGEA
jgi:lipopolysaccharide biosynthesis protein